MTYQCNKCYAVLKIYLIKLFIVISHLYVAEKSNNPTDVDFIPSVFQEMAVPKRPSQKRTTKNSSSDFVNAFDQGKKKRKISHNSVWESDHSYCYVPEKKQKIEMSELEMLRLENIKLKKEKEHLENKSNCIEEVIGSDANCLRYTGLPSFEIFSAISEYLLEQAEKNFKRFSSKHSAGAKKKLTFHQELLLVLARLKTGIFQFDLANRFKISEGQMSKIFSEWLNFLFLELKCLFECPDAGTAKMNSSECFDNFADVRMIIDCTEIFTQQPKKSQSRKEVYSNYKSHNTIKFLVGMSPNLGVTYVSKGWGGRASDTYITINSDVFLENLKEGDSIMADRGFGTNQISSQLSAQGVNIVMPSFKGRERSQLSKSEVVSSEKCSKARIHIERIIQRIKTWHILDRDQQLKMHDIIEQVFTVVAYLTNFQTSIIKPNYR